MYNDSTNSKISTDSFRAYLKMIGTYKLLNAKEEIELCRLVQAHLKVKAVKQPDDTKEQWAERAQLTVKELDRVIYQGRTSKDKMINHNLRLVVSIAKRYTSRGLPIGDLVQEGVFGLSKAVDKFNPELGYKFSTYATHWIRQSITISITKIGRVIRLPTYIHFELNKVRKAYQELTKLTGCHPTIAEVSNKVGMTHQKVQDLLIYSRSTKSLDIIVNKLEGEGKSLEGFIPSNELYSYEEIQQLRNEVDSYMYILNERQKLICNMRWGLNGYDPSIYPAIAKKLGLSKERIKQIELDCIAKMRKEALECQELNKQPL